MNIYDVFQQALREEYNKGVTQEELGRRAGISQQHVNRLLNGRSSFANLKLETMLKLLPKAKINIADMNIVNNGTNSGVIGINNESSSPAAAADAERMRAGLLQGIIDLDIEDSVKVTFLRFVRDFGKKQAEE